MRNHHPSRSCDCEEFVHAFFRGSSAHVLLPNVNPSVPVDVHGGFAGGGHRDRRVCDNV